MLYLIPTPIGNLADITLRCLEVLKTCDLLICEDTRRTSILLQHYQIPKKPILVVNDFNESTLVDQVIAKLQDGATIAMVSDAGTPLINDPGYKIVRMCLEMGIPVDALPGPSAILPALQLSKLPPNRFMYLGYLPEKEKARLDLFEHSKSIHQILPTTFIAFISPHKLGRALEDASKVFGDINIVLAKELTKQFQSVESKKISEWLEIFKKQKIRGEYVLLYNLDT
jgi:16S rRNA (cytidine1402-2'-O)-methyltransferase